MKIIVIITFLGFNGTASSLVQREILDHGGFNTNGIVENSTEQTLTRFGHLASTEFYSTVAIPEMTEENVGGMIVPESSQSRSKAKSVQNLEEWSKPDSRTLPEIRLSHKWRRDSALNDRKISTEKPTSFEELGKRIKELGEPIKHKCSSCPEGQSLCCESGCCGRVAFWMEPPALYFLIAWISVITLVVGAVVAACKSGKPVVVGHVQNRACSQPGPVIFKVEGARVKVRNPGSSSTCESSLADEHDRTDDVFEMEFPDDGCHEVNSHDDGHQGDYYHVEYEHHVDCRTDDTNCHVDYDVTYANYDQECQYTNE